MGKKILIGVGVLVVLLAIAFIYMNNRNRTLSPPGEAQLKNGSLDISLTYSRPSVRDRIVFGTPEEGAIQPYGVYWRLGANESTEITLNTDVTFNGESLNKGTYKLYAVPAKDAFTIGVNTELGKWGYFEPDYTMDLFTTEVPVETISNVEQHTITLEPRGTDGANLIVMFEKVKLTIPIEAK